MSLSSADLRLGQQIRRVRNDLGMTQERFAEALGTPESQSLVSRWEGGKVRPSDRTLYDIARIGRRDPSIFGLPPRIEGASGSETTLEGSMTTPPTDGASAEDFRRRLDRIDGLDGDEAVRVMARDSLAAAYRAHAMVEEARAASLRAEALARAETTSRDRALIAYAKETGRIPRELFRGIEMPHGEEPRWVGMEPPAEEEAAATPAAKP